MDARAHAGAAEAFTWSADYGGADHWSRRREHAVGTSQLTELAASGWGQRAQCLPAPESEALNVDASAAPAHRAPKRQGIAESEARDVNASPTALMRSKRIAPTPDGRANYISRYFIALNCRQAKSMNTGQFGAPV